MNSRTLLNRLSANLGTVKEMIKTEKRVNKQNLGIELETIALKLLNLAKGYSFRNANEGQVNFPGVDGVDDTNRIMVQITSTFSLDKIEKTVNTVLANRLYEKYDRLFFVFLAEKGSLTKASVAKIRDKIGAEFIFDPAEDIFDLDDIYATHSYMMDLPKLRNSVAILDEFLDYVPVNKESGFDAVSVSFHEEEADNVFRVVDALLREGVNVYTGSKELYNRFIEGKHPMKDFLIYSAPSASLSHIRFCLVVLSDSFISRILRDSPNLCYLYKNALVNEIKIEAVSFKQFLRDIGEVSGRDLKLFGMIAKDSVGQSVSDILNRNVAESIYRDIDMDEIERELTNINNRFSCRRMVEQEGVCWFKLRMENQADVEINYVVLGKGYVLGELKNAVTHWRDASVFKNLNVLVPKDSSHTTRRRIELVKTEFPDANVYYIDEFLFDTTYTTLKQEPILNTQEFVNPVFRHNNKLLGVRDVISWVMNHSGSSVAIIHGAGGMGKTTICEKIHDMILELFDRNIMVFIDAHTYIDFFGKNAATDSEYDLYKIFNTCHRLGNEIDANSFYLSYALGNIIFVFDGIDEIISTLPSFTLVSLLDNLENLRRKIGGGKIIINCRDNYVTELNTYYKEQLDRTRFYELLAFDEELAESFFSMHFKEQAAVKGCLRLANDFYPEPVVNGTHRFPPFVLEVISKIVEAEHDFDEIDDTFDSAILQKSDSLDFLVFQICNREYFKKERNGFQLSIDEQIRFLCELAVEENGKTHQAGIERVLENIGLTDRVNEIARGLVDHPFLCPSNGGYVFRFEFFNTYFKSIAIFNLLCAERHFALTDRIIDILSDDCNYNSVLSKTLIDKANKSDVPFEDCLRHSRTMIRRISSFNNVSAATARRRKKAVSNILVVIAASEKPSRYTSRHIISYLFGTAENQVAGVFLMDIPYSTSLLFDFTDLMFSHSEIANYGQFFNCSFNEGTFFDDTCIISGVYDNKINPKTIKTSIDNFDKNIKGDNSIFRALNMKMGGEKEVKRFLKEYLSAFYRSRHFNLEMVERAIVIPEDKFIKVPMISQALIKHGILSRSANDSLLVDGRFKTKIISFLGNGLVFKELNNAMRELLDQLRAGEA